MGLLAIFCFILFCRFPSFFPALFAEVVAIVISPMLLLLMLVLFITAFGSAAVAAFPFVVDAASCCHVYQLHLLLHLIFESIFHFWHGNQERRSAFAIKF